MSLTGSLFTPFMIGATLLGMGLVFWWRSAEGFRFDDPSEKLPGDDLHSLFDELADAAEADGILDQDLEFGPLMTRATNITPVSMTGRGAPAHPLPHLGQPVYLPAQI